MYVFLNLSLSCKPLNFSGIHKSTYSENQEKSGLKAFGTHLSISIPSGLAGRRDKGGIPLFLSVRMS